MRSFLSEITELEIGISDDWIKNKADIPGNAKEILIGKTNRKETEKYLNDLKYDDFIIKKDPATDRIIILGGSDAATVCAVEYFFENYLKDNSVLFKSDIEYLHKTEYKAETLNLEGVDISEYIIYPDTSDDCVKAAKNLQRYITGLTGKEITVTQNPKETQKNRIRIEKNTDITENTCTVGYDGGVLTLKGNHSYAGAYAAGFFIENYLKNAAPDSDKKISVIVGSSQKAYNTEDYIMSESIDIYVSKEGSDDNNGTMEKPFLTLDRAKTEAGRIISNNIAPVNIYIRGGEYYMEKTVSFTAETSGSPVTPITIQAYKDEKVILTGGIKVDNSKIKKADEIRTAKVIDRFAASKIMALNLDGLMDTTATITNGSGSIESGLPEIYINGKALGQSRWPNDEAGTAYLRIKSMKSDAVNYQSMPFSFNYTDETSRAEKYWSEETKKNLYIYGFVAYDWTDGIYKIDTMDFASKTVTTTGGSPFQPQKDTRFYFFNLMEEIDMPGESYMDNESKTIYFYPPCELSGAEIFISTLRTPILSFTSTNYITIKNIEFNYTRGMALNIENGSHMTVDGCIAAHTSDIAISINGTHNTVKNSHIYDNFYGGITVSGGDRASLVSAHNIIENNRLHQNSRTAKTYHPAILCTSIGTIIRNNKIYDSPHQLIEFNTNDVVVEKNEIYNGVLESSDMGAIYYGRNPSVLGIIIQNNYFHDIGNTYGGIGQQSIFCDDGASMPYIYKNIFYKGTLTKEDGGNADNCFPIKSNGSQFGLTENNIFIDAPSAAYFQDWRTSSAKEETRWWKWVYDAYPENEHGIWNKLTNEVDFFSDLWRSTYKDTMWTKVWDYIKPEMYSTVQELFRQGKNDEIEKLAKENAPSLTNRFERNVSVKVGLNKNKEVFAGNGTGSENYTAENDLLPDGSSMFAEYRKDFTLTAEGLAEIQKTIPEFENIDMSEIGLKPYTDDGREINVGGLEPSASNLKIITSADIMTADYEYITPDNTAEGVSVVKWYISDTSDGTYTLISGRQGRELPLEAAYSGKYIKFELTPYNRNTICGEKQMSEEYQVK